MADPVPAPTTTSAPLQESAVPIPPSPRPQPETGGAQLRKLFASPHVNPSLRDFGSLVADYIDGVWLPEDEGATGKRALMLGRKLLVQESEFMMCRDSLSKAEGKALEFEAQLLTLVGEGGGSTKLREELAEARESLVALQQSTGDKMGALFEAHAAALADENASLKNTLALKDSELTELKEVLMEMRRALSTGDKKDLDMFGEGVKEGMRKVNNYSTEG